MSSDAYNKAIESGANPEELKKAMHAMDNLLDSNFVDDYFSDEERLETARKQMLENLDQYEQMMPGFKEQAREIASDPQKWREVGETLLLFSNIYSYYHRNHFTQSVFC